MTYRQDSDIIHSYGRYIDRNDSSNLRDRQTFDRYLSPRDNRSTFNVTNEFVQRENRIVWFVSNCDARNDRNRLANEIGRLFPLDRFGRCVSSNKSEEFETILVRYKFYLAFENSNCEDYLTEKTFYNALSHGAIPIIFGPKYENLQRLIPSSSFLHVDQKSNLTKFVEELKSISEDFQRFENFHRWRNDFRLITWKSNYYLDDRFCDLCIKLHVDQEKKTYKNISNWLNRCH